MTTLLGQIREILTMMKASGRKPLRIHMTWGMMAALRVEMATTRAYVTNNGKTEIMGVPVEIGESGSGLWVSCLSERGEK